MRVRKLSAFDALVKLTQLPEFIGHVGHPIINAVQLVLGRNPNQDSLVVPSTEFDIEVNLWSAPVVAIRVEPLMRK